MLFTWHDFSPIAGERETVYARIGTVGQDGAIEWGQAGDIRVGPHSVDEGLHDTWSGAQVIELSDARVLFLWTHYDGGLAARIGAVDSNTGGIVWDSAEIVVNEEAADNTAFQQATLLDDGRVLFTWQSNDPDVDGKNYGITARIGTIAEDGSAIDWEGGEFTVNTEIQKAQQRPQVTVLSDGRVVFAWQSLDPDVDSDHYGIAARVLNFTGVSTEADEDTSIKITLDPTTTDTDGSESVDRFVISGFPGGTTFSSAHAIPTRPATLSANG